MPQLITVSVFLLRRVPVFRRGSYDSSHDTDTECICLPFWSKTCLSKLDSRGSYMSDHVLLDLLNETFENDKNKAC